MGQGEGRRGRRLFTYVILYAGTVRVLVWYLALPDRYYADVLGM